MKEREAPRESGAINEESKKNDRNWEAELEGEAVRNGEELERTRSALDTLYGELEALRQNTYPMDSIRRQREDEYWNLDKKRSDLEDREKEIEELWGLVSEGTVDQIRLVNLLGEIDEPEQKRLSKRKLKILEEQRKQEKRSRGSAIGPNMRAQEAVHGLYGEMAQGPQTTHLDTGKHARRVKGNFDAIDAGDVFHDKTIDTHGGKVRKKKQSKKRR